MKNVKRGECAIVGVYRNHNPVACIEVKPVDGRFKEIVQAKIINNKAVSQDAQVNQAVLTWMRDRNLTAGAYMRDIFMRGAT